MPPPPPNRAAPPAPSRLNVNAANQSPNLAPTGSHRSNNSGGGSFPAPPSPLNNLTKESNSPPASPRNGTPPPPPPEANAPSGIASPSSASRFGGIGVRLLPMPGMGGMGINPRSALMSSALFTKRQQAAGVPPPEDNAASNTTNNTNNNTIDDLPPPPPSSASPVAASPLSSSVNQVNVMPTLQESSNYESAAPIQQQKKPVGAFSYFGAQATPLAGLGAKDNTPSNTNANANTNTTNTTNTSTNANGNPPSNGSGNRDNYAPVAVTPASPTTGTTSAARANLAAAFAAQAQQAAAREAAAISPPPTRPPSQTLASSGNGATPPRTSPMMSPVQEPQTIKRPGAPASLPVLMDAGSNEYNSPNPNGNVNTNSPPPPSKQPPAAPTTPRNVNNNANNSNNIQNSNFTGMASPMATNRQIPSQTVSSYNPNPPPNQGMNTMNTMNTMNVNTRNVAPSVATGAPTPRAKYSVDEDDGDDLERKEAQLALMLKQQQEERLKSGFKLEHTLVLEGYLKKKSPKGFRPWQERYFLLYSDVLVYFKKKNEKGDPQGSVPLYAIRFVQNYGTKKKGRFDLEVGDLNVARTFKLLASSQTECDSWVQKIKEAIAKAEDATKEQKNIMEVDSKFWKGKAIRTSVVGPNPNIHNSSMSNNNSSANGSGGFGTNSGYGNNSSVYSTGNFSQGIPNSTSFDQGNGMELAGDGKRNDNFNQDENKLSPHSTSPAGSARGITASGQSGQYISSSHGPHTGASAALNSPTVSMGLRILRQLTVGPLGCVYLAHNKHDNSYALLHVVMKSDTDAGEVTTIRSLFHTMASLDEAFILKQALRGESSDAVFAAYTPAFRPSDSILSHLNHVRRLPEAVVRLYAAQLSLALGYIHQNGFFFHNLSPENVYIDGEGNTIIADFLLTLPSSQIPAECDVVEYATPESLALKLESTASDWWRLGVLLYEVAVGIPPFRTQLEGAERDKELKRIITAHTAESIRFPPFISASLQSLIRSLLEPNSKKRIGAGAGDWQEIREHGFFMDPNTLQDLVGWDSLMHGVSDNQLHGQAYTWIRSNILSRFPCRATSSQLKMSQEIQNYYTSRPPKSTAGGDSDEHVSASASVSHSLTIELIEARDLALSNEEEEKATAKKGKGKDTGVSNNNAMVNVFCVVTTNEIENSVVASVTVPITVSSISFAAQPSACQLPPYEQMSSAMITIDVRQEQKGGKHNSSLFGSASSNLPPSILLGSVQVSLSSVTSSTTPVWHSLIGADGLPRGELYVRYNYKMTKAATEKAKKKEVAPALNVQSAALSEYFGMDDATIEQMNATKNTGVTLPPIANISIDQSAAAVSVSNDNPVTGDRDEDDVAPLVTLPSSGDNRGRAGSQLNNPLTRKRTSIFGSRSSVGSFAAARTSSASGDGSMGPPPAPPTPTGAAALSSAAASGSHHSPITHQRQSSRYMPSTQTVKDEGDDDDDDDDEDEGKAGEVMDSDDDDDEGEHHAGEGIARKIRGLVSKKKKRFQEDGFDLDLAYVTKRIIAMGFPSEGTQGIYRNPMSEVQRFLHKYHHNAYRVYNLCSERKYPHAKFNGRVADCPFDDHNAPPFSLMLSFCEDAYRWLQADPKHVIAVHCKAGKGRTGTMIAALLLYDGTFTDGEEALQHFGAQRTYDGKGVTIPSRKRRKQQLINYTTPLEMIPQPTIICHDGCNQC